jgi:hypothetical protein
MLCSLKSSGGTTTPTYFFKTNMNGGNQSFIAIYKDINKLFIY